MDPTPDVCAIRYSFNSYTPPKDKYLFNIGSSEGDIPTISVFPSSDYPNDIYAPYKKNIENAVKLSYDLRAQAEGLGGRFAFEHASEMCNPYKIGRSIFPMSEYSVILANIDALFNISGAMRVVTSTNPYVYDVKKENGNDFYFCSLCDGPGGFTKYMQYRRPQSYGFGMSKFYDKDFRGQNWKTAELDMTRFDILEDDNRTGDLIRNYPKIIEHARGMSREVDLVLANGGVRQDELASMNLILTEIYVSLLILAYNGDAVFRVTDINTILMMDVMYLLHYAFDKVALFKPCSSSPTSMERYIVCRYRNKNIGWIIDALSQALTIMKNGGVVASLVDDHFSDAFMDDFEDINLDQIKEYNRHMARTLEYIKTGKVPSDVAYDSDRFLIYWALPSNAHFYRPPVHPVAQSIKSIGKRVIETYHYALVHRLRKITDRTENVKELKSIHSELIRLAFGINEKLPMLPLEQPWTHVRVGDFYTFTSGSLVYKCIASNIDQLIKYVNGDWNAIYQLVERYYPFTRVFIDTLPNVGSIVAFGNPLVHVGGRYCSLYEEDKIFGSLGVVHKVFPMDGEWIFYSHAMDNVLLNISKTCLEFAGNGTHVHLYTPIWPSNTIIQKMTEMSTRSDVQVTLYDYNTQRRSKPTSMYLFEK